MGDTWLPHFQQYSPAYEIFSWLPTALQQKNDWPTLADYNQLLKNRPNPITNSQKLPIKLVAQSKQKLSTDLGYEQRAYLHGEVQTRANNWHDFFNMLIWCTFPKSKASINQLQHCELTKRGATIHQRSSLENFLTLFDENGIVIISSEISLLKLVKTMQWKEFFWFQRAKLMQSLKCMIIGHSLHEKLLNPYIGMVGHAFLLQVPDSFFSLELQRQVATIDHLIADQQFDLLTPRDLFPVPILGFPNWHLDTMNESFYDDQKYFRTTKTKAK